MQEPELNNELSPTDHPSWWKRILIGTLAGAFFGALNIWFVEFSLLRLLAAIVSGASFFALCGLLAVSFGSERLKVAAVGGFAGFVAGAMYWVVARPSSSLILALGIGLVGGAVYTWVESRD